MIIKGVKARIIMDSRKNPAIEVILNTSNGIYRASAPSGASTGKFEIRAYPKAGINAAVDYLNNLKKFKNYHVNDFNDFRKIEKFFNPSMGGNVIIAFEFALLKSLAKGKIWKFFNPKPKQLPLPVGNVVGGGAHLISKNKLDIQEYLLIPHTATFKEAVKINNDLYRLIGKKLKTKRKTDEGAWAPENISDLEAFDIIISVMKDYSEKQGVDVHLGIDLASSQLYNKRRYSYDNFSPSQKKKDFIKKDQIALINDWINRYHLAYIEDPLEEQDFSGYKNLDHSALLVGDDLIVTDIRRLKKSFVNAVIIKPNQIGSLVKTKEIVDYCLKKNIVPIISHRSGETLDATISQLAVAWKIPFIKCGINGKEREAKLKEILRIEKEIKRD